MKQEYDSARTLVEVGRARQQHQGLAVDSRSDQFSYAVTAWEVLHRALPFAGDDMATICAKVLAQRIQPPPASSPVPEAVTKALRRGLGRSARARYPNMEAFVEALEKAAS